MASRGSDAASVTYECPDCHAQQPEPGRCGRCPGITRPVGLIVFGDVDHNAECIRNALTKLARFDPLDEDGERIYKARKEAEHG